MLEFSNSLVVTEAASVFIESSSLNSQSTKLQNSTIDLQTNTETIKPGEEISIVIWSPETSNESSRSQTESKGNGCSEPLLINNPLYKTQHVICNKVNTSKLAIPKEITSDQPLCKFYIREGSPNVNNNIKEAIVNIDDSDRASLNNRVVSSEDTEVSNKVYVEILTEETYQDLCKRECKQSPKTKKLRHKKKKSLSENYSTTHSVNKHIVTSLKSFLESQSHTVDTVESTYNILDNDKENINFNNSNVDENKNISQLKELDIDIEDNENILKLSDCKQSKNEASINFINTIDNFNKNKNLKADENLGLKIPEKLEDKTPENLEDNKTPEKLEDKTPENLEEKTPEKLEDKTPENFEEKTPENLEEKTPETLIEIEPVPLLECVSNLTQNKSTHENVTVTTEEEVEFVFKLSKGKIENVENLEAKSVTNSNNLETSNSTVEECLSEKDFYGSFTATLNYSSFQSSTSLNSDSSEFDSSEISQTLQESLLHSPDIETYADNCSEYCQEVIVSTSDNFLTKELFVELPTEENILHKSKEKLNYNYSQNESDDDTVTVEHSIYQVIEKDLTTINDCDTSVRNQNKGVLLDNSDTNSLSTEYSNLTELRIISDSTCTKETNEVKSVELLPNTIGKLDADLSSESITVPCILQYSDTDLICSETKNSISEHINNIREHLQVNIKGDNFSDSCVSEISDKYIKCDKTNDENKDIDCEEFIENISNNSDAIFVDDHSENEYKDKANLTISDVVDTDKLLSKHIETLESNCIGIQSTVSNENIVIDTIELTNKSINEESEFSDHINLVSNNVIDVTSESKLKQSVIAVNESLCECVEISLSNAIQSDIVEIINIKKNSDSVVIISDEINNKENIAIENNKQGSDSLITSGKEKITTPTSNMVIRTINEEDELIKDKVFKRKYYSKNNKRKKQQPFSGSEIFKFSDYDCIGLDLDNTVCRYKIGNIMRMEYKYIAEYLVNRYNYDTSLLLPLDDDMDFLQKGLIMDIKRGNFLKCSKEGKILRATHGTRPMTRAQILEVYGPDKIWEPVLEFSKTLYDQGSQLIRSFKDYFDLPAAVACARAVDAEDRLKDPPEIYDVWPDVHVAMCSLYRRENYRNNLGGFFPEIKELPEKYIYESSDKLKKWLKSINEHTFTFLISGSSIDYASYIAKYVLGPDWRDYFDMMICTAKKPGFFTGERSFTYIDGIDDGDEVPSGKLSIDGTYAYGNWNELHSLVKRETGVDNPHCLYIGDHLCQDVLTPSQCGIDTVAIIDELAAEGMIGDSMDHDSGADLMSSYFGSFFTTDGDKNVMGIERINTLYGNVAVQHSRLAIPSLEAVARYPIKHQYESFTDMTSGFFPGDPVILHF